MDIYCDGACSGNQFKKNIGAWGYIVVDNNNRTGAVERDTTNNRMELIAFHESLKYAARSGKDCIIYTDSSYVFNAYNRLVIWKVNKWKSGSGKAIKHMDLWTKIWELQQYSKVKVKKVQAHTDDKWNNEVDLFIHGLIRDAVST